MNVSRTLATLGVPQATIPVAGQYLYFLPTTSDPDTQGVRIIIKALQVGLKRLGHNVLVNGVFDEATARAIDTVSQPAGSWQVKTWVQLLGNVVDALKNPQAQAMRLNALSGYTAQNGIFEDLMQIGPAAQFLKWGYGVTSTQNCAPADSATKTVFSALQRQINRNGGGIVEDGIIGKNTVAALQRLSSITGINPSTCADVANNAILIGMKLKSAADGKGVPDSAGKLVATSNERPQGTIYQSQEALTPDVKKQLALGGLGQYLPYAFIAAGAAWFVLRRSTKHVKGGFPF